MGTVWSAEGEGKRCTPVHWLDVFSAIDDGRKIQWMLSIVIYNINRKIQTALPEELRNVELSVVPWLEVLPVGWKFYSIYKKESEEERGAKPFPVLIDLQVLVKL